MGANAKRTKPMIATISKLSELYIPIKEIRIRKEP